MGRHLDREATSVASLELRIPPVALAVLIGALMWIVRLISPSLTIEFQRGNVVASAIAILGVASARAGVLEFRRARTTVARARARGWRARPWSALARVRRRS